MAKRGRRGSAVSRLLALAISAGVGAILLAVMFGWDLGLGRGRAGKVLGTKTAFNPTGDLDGDGVSNAKDRDDDNDGWSDVNDPLPLSKSDLDNDGLANGQDADDDGDGILDKNDRVYDATLKKYVDLSWDQNNNKRTDTEERANSRNFDGDGDGRPDLAELHEVVKAQAAKLGIAVSAQAKTLADYPKEALQNLPHGWWYVCNDGDNDGVPHGLDKDERNKKGGNYAHYTDGGQWEKTYALYDDKGDVFGFISKCVGCTSVKSFSVPTFISGGGDHSWGRGRGSRPHASFYKKYEEGFFGKFSGHYRSLPQYHGGAYVEAAGSAAQGEGGAHSGGSWFSHVGGGHTGGGGGTLGGGGGHISGGGGGGGGGCSHC